ncbi:MAG TPA: alkene reductase [Candidatus Methylacidiphilales bacterium]
MNPLSPLAEPVRIGAWQLPNRVVMSPLTRCRAGAGRVPTPLMAEYYRQRSGAGLIVTEATSVEPMGVGYPDTPGIWSPEQVEGWKGVTKAVHETGGRILLQLWHVGRISDPIYLDGKLPVAPSAVASSGHISLVRPKRPFVTPRALEREEIPAIVEAFRKGAANAKEAGFDGVEVHGANGYLLDQFLHDGSNKRTDDYGGSIENRARLLFEVVDAAISVWGADRVGIHLAPRGDAYDMDDSDPEALYLHVAREARKRNVAFLFARESVDDPRPRLVPKLKEAFGGSFIVNEKLSKEHAEDLIRSGVADAAAWGALFIANPDLPARFAEGKPLNDPVPDTFFGSPSGPENGYTDYPFMKD